MPSSQIVPGNTTVGTGATFTMYTSASPKGVTWAISKTTGCTGNACGTLSGATDTSVVYNAPVSMSGTTMSVTITATSKTDSSISASQTLTVYPVSVQLTGTIQHDSRSTDDGSVHRVGARRSLELRRHLDGYRCNLCRFHRRLRFVSRSHSDTGDLPRPSCSSVRKRHCHGDINLRSGRKRFDHTGHSETRDLRLHAYRATGSRRRTSDILRRSRSSATRRPTRLPLRTFHPG